MQYDPTGKNRKEPGAKLDGDKTRMALLVTGFPRALNLVGIVATYGAAKYTDEGWREVPDAQKRYMDAAIRHLIPPDGRAIDPETGIPHTAHAIWNLMAVLELQMEEQGVVPSRMPSQAEKSITEFEAAEMMEKTL